MPRQESSVACKWKNPYSTGYLSNPWINLYQHKIRYYDKSLVYLFCSAYWHSQTAIQPYLMFVHRGSGGKYQCMLPDILALGMTRNKMRVAIESGEGMKVKVVKLCWNKCNGPFLMHIYDKQCGIMQKNQWKCPNFQIQCFYNGTSGALCWKRKKNTKTRETKTQITQIFEKVWPI